MKKMIYFAAFAIMMAMGNMNAYAKVSVKHNEIHMNDKGIVVAHHGDHGMPAVHKMSKHERRMIEERRRMEKCRRMEEARRIEEMRRLEAHRRHMAHHREVVVVNGNAAAGVAAGVAVAAFISALMK
ncbi:MAG: hypothetical protein J6Y59_04980 [Bacteroidaceae bacterium]|nr:hypothetical protein [Bacteroidaceae bacterium]